ncbi:MAG: Zn-dependent hydrolase, including glyoxylase [Anaerocolumna sp.]|jgi:glyoxylase-like metal-dependent hydrolase (beta-lactamase superfamily II)|nr:Zn-dependent hydrolase, including glyoxylase [Anaerocolumna sp.]
MKILTFVLGRVETNCYFIINEETMEVILVDPADKAKQIDLHLKEQSLKPVAILLTHGHFDHIMAIPELQELYHLPVYAMEEEKGLLSDPAKNYSAGVGKRVVVNVTHPLKDKDKITLAGMDITVIYTPGHTIGGACYYFDKEAVLFSGDTLFRGTIGRTDFPTGNYDTLIDSLNSKLMVLPDEITVYPGHDRTTTIGYERNNNPYIA